jgi:integrative and conjugative element protein (TIGR02256 family)
MFKRKITISLRPMAAANLRDRARQAAPKETGGLLLGWWAGEHVVVDVIIEVDDPEATATSWMRHEDRAREKLDSELARQGHPWLGYVGDWHSHPAARNASNIDISSLQAASQSYAKSLALLVVKSDDEIDAHAAKRGRLRPVKLTIEGEVNGKN